MKQNIKITYNIPELESGYSIPVSKEDYEKFMGTWEDEKYKWEEKWKGDYAQPMVHTYIPMDIIDKVGPKQMMTQINGGFMILNISEDGQ